MTGSMKQRVVPANGVHFEKDLAAALAQDSPIDELHGTLAMIDSTALELSQYGWVVWICLMGLWTGVQILLTLVKPNEA